MQTKIYLTPTDLVERYKGKITVRTLANWRSQGISPPFTKIGGRILYEADGLEDWERRRTVSSTALCGAFLFGLCTERGPCVQPVYQPPAASANPFVLLRFFACAKAVWLP